MPKKLAETMEFEKRMRIAAACCHDAVIAAERADVIDARKGMLQACANLAELSLDFQAACDFGPTATADAVLAWMIGQLLTRTP